MQLISAVGRISSANYKRLIAALYFKSHTSNRFCSSASEKDAGTTYYDVIIAGGGIVGSALACAIDRSTALEDHRVLLLEASSARDALRELSPGYSNRVSSVNPSSVALFDELAAWDDIRGARAQPVRRIQVWDACSDAFISYDNERMRKELSYIVENDVVVDALARRLRRPNGRVEVLYGAKVKTYELPTRNDREPVAPVPPVRLELEDGRKLEASLLVGADGAGSLVRKTMGVKYLQWSYGQQAVVATLRLSEPTDNTVAWQRFLPTGPVAILPLGDDRSSLVWSNAPENCRRLLSLADDEFVDALNEALWSDKDRLAWMEKVSSGAGRFLKAFGATPSVRQLPPNIESIEGDSRAAFPLALGHASNYVGERVVLVGDAAHRVHPLAGLGVNLGLGDVADLVRTLETARRDGCEVSDQGYLRDYETRRQRHVVPTMAAIDGLHRLYTTKMPLVVLMRSVGLQFTDSCEPLKQRIINHASA